MSKILDVLKEFDIAGMLPEMGKFLGTITWLLRLFLLAGPIVMAALGAIYYFVPPKEANYSLGYRSRWSMSSVEVWTYAQRIAGLVYMCLGGLLTVAMTIVVIVIRGRDPMGMLVTCMICLLIQLGLAVASWIVIEIFLRRNYDVNGNPKY
jgi:uncharacterized membrane protein